jgi:hypothetical protein
MVNDFSENWFPLWGIMLCRQSRQSRPTTFFVGFHKRPNFTQTAHGNA